MSRENNDMRRRRRGDDDRQGAASIQGVASAAHAPGDALAREEQARIAAGTAQPLAPHAPMDAQALVDEMSSMDPDEFGRLMSMGAPRRLQPGDRVEGLVVRVTHAAVFVDLGAKSEAILNLEDLESPPALGDTVKAYVLRADSRGIQLTLQLGGRDADVDTMEQAMEAAVPVEGRITAHNSGGFTVMVGSLTAFCPLSQIDRFYTERPEDYVGQSYTFRVIDVTGTKVVLSRRELLAEAAKVTADALWETIAPGDALDGVVVNIRDFGVFVDVDGLQGLVPKRELGWSDEDAAPPRRGMRVRVRVIDVDKGARKATFSMKDPAFSPWAQVGRDFLPGEVYEARVTRLTDFGAFLELGPGLEGLAHISALAKKRIEHPSEVVSVGDRVRVRLLSIDIDRQRLELSVKQADDADYDPEAAAERRETAEAMKQVRGTTTLGTMADLFGGIKLSGSSSDGGGKSGGGKGRKGRR